MHSIRVFALACAIAAVPLHSQEVIHVGKASYSATPPVGLMLDKKRNNADIIAEVEQRKLFLVKDDGRPIPSNKWYQNIIFHQYGTGLWTLPHKLDATAEGVEFFYPVQPDPSGMWMTADFPLVITGRDFKPVDSRAKQWTDWTVSFRSFESEQRYMDVTLGEGMPMAWFEFTGVQPIVALGGNWGNGTRGKDPASFFQSDGSAATLPHTGNAIGITYKGRSYGVFAPAGTKFEQTDAGLAVTFAGKASFLTIAALPSPQDLARFQPHAASVPRDTQLTWDYDRAAGRITTTWKVITEALDPSASGKVIQGFLPHHWRENVAPLDLSGPAYTTMRGAMKCAIGDSFTIAYPFNGIVPNLPAPAAKTFDAERIRALLAEHYAETKKGLGGDTYWGGKDVQRYAQAAFIATQTKDPSLDAILGKLRPALENWFTFTPGEKNRFFAYYPRRKGLIGFASAYGSEHFTDHHFHLGYFVYTSGLLSQLQPDFAQRYGEFAKLLVKSYANYDRKDTRFPRFRTFDLWRGHSFADGKGFPEGNNQESTGEAVNSWAGMILLGEALGDPELTAAGVMGYSFETRANVEYWFDPHDDVFPKSYAHNACGMIWCHSIVWGTWFTASPAWIYGIQWLPSAPHAAFYDRDRKFIEKVFADADAENAKWEAKEAAKKPDAPKKPGGIKGLGGELGSYHLGFLMHANPARVVGEIDRHWAEPGDKVAHDQWMMNIYYQASALTELGRVDWTAHGDSPTSMVYVNEASKRRTGVAWNPTAKPKTVVFSAGGKAIGRIEVAPHSIGRVELAP